MLISASDNKLNTIFKNLSNICDNIVKQIGFKQKYENLLHTQDFFEGRIQNLEYENKKLIENQEKLISKNEELGI